MQVQRHARWSKSCASESHVLGIRAFMDRIVCAHRSGHGLFRGVRVRLPLRRRRGGRWKRRAGSVAPRRVASRRVAPLRPEAGPPSAPSEERLGQRISRDRSSAPPPVPLAPSRAGAVCDVIWCCLCTRVPNQAKVVDCLGYLRRIAPRHLSVLRPPVYVYHTPCCKACTSAYVEVTDTASLYTENSQD